MTRNTSWGCHPRTPGQIVPTHTHTHIQHSRVQSQHVDVDMCAELLCKDPCILSGKCTDFRATPAAFLNYEELMCLSFPFRTSGRDSFTCSFGGFQEFWKRTQLKNQSIAQVCLFPENFWVGTILCGVSVTRMSCFELQDNPPRSPSAQCPKIEQKQNVGTNLLEPLKSGGPSHVLQVTRGRFDGSFRKLLECCRASTFHC